MKQDIKHCCSVVLVTRCPQHLPTKISRAASNADWICRFTPTLYVCVQPVSAQYFLLVGSGSNGDPQAVRTNHIPSSRHFSLMKKMFLSQSLSSFFPLLIHLLPLLRVISQAALKWPPAIFPNPSYMLFGAVSSKPHLCTEPRGSHCAVTGSIDFLLETGKFCLMASHLKGHISPY